MSDKKDQRLQDLAREKSKLELFNRMLTRLSSVAGLKNMVQNIIDILMQTIGATNISIIFRLENEWQYCDIYGVKKVFLESEDPDISSVLASGKMRRVQNADKQTPALAGDGTLITESWLFPLIARDIVIGAVCMEDMQLLDESIIEELQPFFVYSGMMLDNEISNYSQLAESHQNLQASEILFRTLFEQSPDGVILFSAPELKPIKFNETACSMLGYTKKEFSDITVSDFEKSMSQDEIDNLGLQLFREDKTINFETSHHTKSGDILPVSVTLRSLELSGQKFILTIHRDMSEAKTIEKELFDIKDLFSIFIHHSPIYTFIKEVTPTESRVIRASENYLNMTGVAGSEMVGKTMQDLFPTDFAEKITADDWMIVTRGKVLEIEETLDGRFYETIKFPIVQDSRKLLAGYTIDVTERKKAEEERLKLEQQVIQSQKIESIGQLAGGVAHDFNNMLGVIIGHTEMALRKAGPSSAFVHDLQEISKAAQRSAELTRQLLTFARKQIIEPIVLDLNESVAGTLKMLQRLIGENIKLSWNPAAILWPVKVDPSQIDQILTNLCVNSRDAISGTGKISIKTANTSWDEDAIASHPYEVVPGDYVQLCVSDDGCGMDKKAQSHIFEPFYTTKEVGSGTGLGLATVYGAVKQNHGFLTVYSEPGLGSVFNIYFPRTSKAVEAKQETAEEPLLRGTETVLLVEDDEMLLRLVTSMLEESGYTVLAASTAALAQSLAKEHPDPIHLLISDMIMPVMNGKELSDKLQPLRPEMKVLFLSGYTTDIISSQGVIEGEIHFLQKPFSLETLTAKVREVLDGH